MSSSYSPILRTELIGSGDQAGAWGATTNSNFQYIFEAAIAGYQVVTVSPTANNQVLTYVNGPSSTPSLDQSIYAMLKLNAGTLGANFNIFAPPVSKTYIIWNNTAYSATIYNSTVIGNTTAAGSGISIPAGLTSFVWSDGSNFYSVITGSSGNLSVSGNLTVGGTATAASLTLGAPLPVLSGGTGVTTSTGTGSTVLSVSPTFTGIPLAPTATTGTNTTQVATTAFVQNIAGTLGTMSAQNATSVAITGGTITGTYALNTIGASGSIANTGGWAVTPSGTKLYFSYNGTNVGSLDSSGNFIAKANVTAYGTP